MSKNFDAEFVLRVTKLFALRKIILGGRVNEIKRQNKNL